MKDYTEGELQPMSMGEAPDKIVLQIERDGGAIVTDFFNVSEVKAINSEMNSAIDEHRPGARTGEEFRKEFHGKNTKRITRLFAISPTFRRVLDDPLLKAIADHFLLAPSGPYWLNSAQAIIRGPGEGVQTFHRDNGNWPVFAQLQQQLPQATVSFMFAMTPFTAATGATVVVPYSHLRENYERRFDLTKAIPVEMPAGSVFAYLGSTLHAGGANTTADQWRRGIFLAFCLGWLVPSEVSVLEYPLDMARGLSARGRQLLGFKGYEPGRGRGGKLWNIDYEDIGFKLGLDEVQAGSE